MENSRLVIVENSRFTRKQRRHLMIAFAAVSIATLCILFLGQ
jgi:hypothetical protein